MPSPLRRPFLAVLAAVVLALGACTVAGPAPRPTLTATVQAPDADVVLGVGDAPGLALEASRTFFEQAPFVVVAPGEDPGATLTAASLAAVIGAPVLLDGTDPEALAAELDRLGTEVALAVGGAQALSAMPTEEEPTPAPLVETLTVPDDAAGAGALLGLDLAEGEPVAEGEHVPALAALDIEAPTLLRPEGEPTPEPGPTPSPLDSPTFAPTVRLSGVTALSDGTAEQVAAVGTARAAGAAVLVAPGGDPRASSEVVQALAANTPDVVVALGPAFGTDDDLAWRVATASTGVELPGGNQLVFAGKMKVALYGTPGTPSLGVLGEQGIPETIARARQHAAQYEPFTDVVVVPALEIIATVADRVPGADGDYSAERPISALRPLIDAAQEEGIYVVLDLQPGRTDFLTQARLYEELLLLPHVGLALDPEWRLRPDQIHLRQIGSVGIEEVNQVVTYLADLTRDHHLPQKLLVLHQFRHSMIRDRAQLDMSRTELALTIHVDGQGSQPEKAATWASLQQGAPEGIYWGWKNFYDEDTPMLTAEQTMRIEPRPDLVTYQ